MSLDLLLGVFTANGVGVEFGVMCYKILIASFSNLGDRLSDFGVYVAFAYSVRAYISEVFRGSATDSA